MDEKQIIEAIEEGTKTLKKDFEKKQKEQGESFEKKVNDLLDDLGVKMREEFEEKQMTKEAGEKMVADAVEDAGKKMQESFDEFATKYKHTIENQPKKVKSIKNSIKESIKENHEKLKSLAGSDQHLIQLKDMGFEDFTGYTTFTQDVRNQVIPTKEEAFHVRQILGSGSTTGDTVYYPKATGKTGDGPEPWDYDHSDDSNTVAKADFEFTFDNVSAQVKWIAGILRIPRQMLDDLAWLQSYISTYAPIELLKAEDAQIIDGDGIGNNISGLITNATAYSAGLATYEGIERIIDAGYGQMATVNQDTPTDVLLSPRDVVKIILNKASTSGEYNLPEGVIGWVNGRLEIAGLAVRKTNKITANTFLVGDFMRGANLVNRMAPQLRAFETDRDNVVKNMITFRIEERIALPIFYDEAFVTGALFGT